MTGTHASMDLVERYATGEPGIAPDVLWALEAHLEGCAVCRARLAAATTAAPDVTALVDRVRVGLDDAVARGPRPVRAGRWLPRRTLRWVAPTLLRYLAMTLVLVLIAVLFDLLTRTRGAHLPSIVLLSAPVAPLLGVAAVWTSAADPAYELVAATPRAGLYLILRRTLAVLVMVLPVLVVAGWVVGASPARWLVPCLAFTVGALALGEVVGVPRAAGGLTLLWTAAVIAPSVATAHLPFVLRPASLPGWAGLTVAVAALIVVRRRAYTRLPSQ
jgi:hypothetical protein